VVFLFHIQLSKLYFLHIRVVQFQGVKFKIYIFDDLAPFSIRCKVRVPKVDEFLICVMVIEGSGDSTS
jgi:hypothetical protein